MKENLVHDLASEETEGTPILKCHIMAYLGHMPFLPLSLQPLAPGLVH